MRYLLNIGKVASPHAVGGKFAISDSYILSELGRSGLRPVTFDANMHDMESEPVFVALVEDARPFANLALSLRIHELAERLHQDCIAAIPMDGDQCRVSYGTLIGPRASAWGRFDLTQFTFPEWIEQCAEVS